MAFESFLFSLLQDKVKSKYFIFSNYIKDLLFNKYITPVFKAISIYDSNISNELDCISKELDTNEIYNLCDKLLDANKFWVKKCKNTEYICIDKLSYDLQEIYPQEVYKDEKSCLIELFNDAWCNVFQYVCLNQDILDDNLKTKLKNIIAEIEKLSIILPEEYKNIINSKSNPKDCYVFAHKKFVDNNIDILFNYPVEIIVDWCDKYRSKVNPYEADVYQCYFPSEVYYELCKEIIKIYLSGMHEQDNRLKVLIKKHNDRYKSYKESIKFRSILINNCKVIYGEDECKHMLYKMENILSKLKFKININ